MIGSTAATSFDRLLVLGSVIQAVAITAAGAWGLYVYLRTRQGQVQVGIETSCRLLRDWSDGKAVLLVRMRLMNTSNVVYHHREATATLMDARKEAGDGSVRLVPFKQADPFPPVYGDLIPEASAIREGRSFHLEPESVSLEPGEYVDSEIAFVLDSEKLGLMGLRILLRGRQRRWRPEDYWWGKFLYVVPGSLEVESESRPLEEKKS